MRTVKARGGESEVFLRHGFVLIERGGDRSSSPYYLPVSAKRRRSWD